MCWEVAPNSVALGCERVAGVARVLGTQVSLYEASLRVHVGWGPGSHRVQSCLGRAGRKAGRTSLGSRDLRWPRNQSTRVVMQVHGRGGRASPRCGTEVVCELTADVMKTHGRGAGCMEREGPWVVFCHPCPSTGGASPASSEQGGAALWVPFLIWPLGPGCWPHLCLEGMVCGLT